MSQTLGRVEEAVDVEIPVVAVTPESFAFFVDMDSTRAEAPAPSVVASQTQGTLEEIAYTDALSEEEIEDKENWSSEHPHAAAPVASAKPRHPLEELGLDQFILLEIYEEEAKAKASTSSSSGALPPHDGRPPAPSSSRAAPSPSSSSACAADVPSSAAKIPRIPRSSTLKKPKPMELPLPEEPQIYNDEVQENTRRTLRPTDLLPATEKSASKAKRSGVTGGLRAF